jgi:hypothetical protein
MTSTVTTEAAAISALSRNAYNGVPAAPAGGGSWRTASGSAERVASGSATATTAMNAAPIGGWWRVAELALAHDGVRDEPGLAGGQPAERADPLDDPVDLGPLLGAQHQDRLVRGRRGATVHPEQPPDRPAGGPQAPGHGLPGQVVDHFGQRGQQHRRQQHGHLGEAEGQRAGALPGLRGRPRIVEVRVAQHLEELAVLGRREPGHQRPGEIANQVPISVSPHAR